MVEILAPKIVGPAAEQGHRATRIHHQRRELERLLHTFAVTVALHHLRARREHGAHVIDETQSDPLGHVGLTGVLAHVVVEGDPDPRHAAGEARRREGPAGTKDQDVSAREAREPDAPDALAMLANTDAMTGLSDDGGAAFDDGVHPGHLSTATMMGATAAHILGASESARVDTALPRAVLSHYERAIAAGHGQDNWTSIYEVIKAG